MDIFFEKIKKSIIPSKTNYFIMLGFVGILLISISELMPEKTSDIKISDTYDSYKSDMEKQLVDILSSVNGAGQVKVMITLESGKETVYVQQEKLKKDEEQYRENEDSKKSVKDSYENEIVMIEEDNQKKALVEKVMEPVVQGVVVVCSGADDISVVSDITNAVCIALNLSSNRVCVIKMK